MSTYARYKSVLTLSLLSIVSGLLLTAFSLFSPLWQVAEFENAEVRHEHGLWKDCVATSNHLIPLSEVTDSSKPLNKYNCSNKFDQDSQTTIKNALPSNDDEKRELLLHRFLPQHKAVLFFGVFTFLFGMIGIVIGICSPCFPPNSLLYVVAIFMTTACSLLADVIFMYAAQKKDNSLIQLNGIQYDNEIGVAAYLHMFSTMLFVGSLLLSIVAAYLLITCGESRGDGCCARKTSYLANQASNNNWRSTGVIVRTCDKQHCKPFIVVNDDHSSE